jgi:hypothetical protein
MAFVAPDVVERVRQLGQSPSPAGAAEFARYIRDDYARWGRVVKASGAKAARSRSRRESFTSRARSRPRTRKERNSAYVA